MKTMVSTAGSGPPGGSESPQVLLPGAKAGPWVIERELGRGGMGAVYAVVHEAIGKRAALKVVHPRLLVPGFNTDRMLLEAKIVNQVGHPNIVDIFETGKLADGRPYIVMERLEGHTLSARADQSKLMPDLVIAILLQVCDALIAAHTAGVVHRDLKLDNVFLVDNPEDPATPKVKLLDWGIAKVLSHDAKYTLEGQLMGTPQYLAPEQARGQPVSPQTDVYSLGVMAYELFLEQLPFEAETAAEVMAMHLRAAPPPPSELWPDIPAELQDLLLAMLAKPADERPTMAEVARRLEAVRGELERRCRIRIHHRAGSAADSQAMPSRSGRAVSSPGLAATQPFGAHAARRWQYAVGALALALSALMLWISRDGDRAASAATAPPALAERALGASAGTLAGPGDTAVSSAPSAADSIGAPPAVAPILAVADEVAAPPRRAAAPRAPAARPARPDPAPRAAAPIAATRSSPALPHRKAKVDPDGTLDAYR